MSENPLIEPYWQAFLDIGGNRAAYGGRVHPDWYFCNNEKDADALLALVLAGTKRGTASLEEAYAWDDEEVPVAGDLSILTDFAGTPRCVIETINVIHCPYSEVTEEMAAIEGEGDKSLAYWRRAHKWFFGEELAGHGREFTDDVMVIFEEFRVLHQG